MKLKTMTLEEAINHRSSSLWVVNTFLDSSGRPADIVGESYPRSGNTNQAKEFKIPASWAPQNLSEIAPKEDFLEGSSDFLSALKRNWLIIVDPSEVQSLVTSNPSVQTEMDRLRVSAQGVRAGVNLISRDKEEGIQLDIEKLRSEHNRPWESEEEPLDGISPQIRSIMEREDLSDAARLNSLRTLAQSVSPQEIAFIQQRTSDQKILNFLELELTSNV